MTRRRFRSESLAELYRRWRDDEARLTRDRLGSARPAELDDSELGRALHARDASGSRLAALRAERERRAAERERLDEEYRQEQERLADRPIDWWN